MVTQLSQFIDQVENMQVLGSYHTLILEISYFLYILSLHCIIKYLLLWSEGCPFDAIVFLRKNNYRLTVLILRILTPSKKYRFYYCLDNIIDQFWLILLNLKDIFIPPRKIIPRLKSNKMN